jgi:hypothetical protein
MDAYEDSGNEHFHDSKFYAAKIRANKKPAKLTGKKNRWAQKSCPGMGQLIHFSIALKLI